MAVFVWKPTIDAMGAVLGAADPAKPFDLDDGRITELHLHVTREAALGSDVEVAFWWRAAG